MYLIDTSVWIDLFRQKETSASERLRSILEQDIPFGITSVIYQELLQGARDESDYQKLRSYLKSQQFYHPVHDINSYAEAARIHCVCRRKGITIRSTIDCLIATVAIEHKLVLLHDDMDFFHMAKVIPDLKACSE